MIGSEAVHPRAFALVAAIAPTACAPEAPPPEAPPPRWVYEPPLPSWQFGEDRGAIGRSQPPQPVRGEGITGEVTAPLRVPALWPVPVASPARAVVDGFEGVRPAIELIDVDRGAVVWRDHEACGRPVVGVTAAAIVCGDRTGTRALGIDGKPRWKLDAAFVAFTDGRVVVVDRGEPVMIDATTGVRSPPLALPAGVAADTIVATCGNGELLALGPDGRLARVVAGKQTWATPVGTLADLEPCTGGSILVAADHALLALDRATGQVTGRVDAIRGWWPARDGSGRIEIATAAIVESWPRDLVGPPVGLPMIPPAGPLLARRGNRRLVRATELTALLLDRTGVRGYLPLAATGAVLGEAAVLAATWTAGPGEVVRRIAIPPPDRRTVRVPRRGDGVAVPAELRDLPEVATIDPGTAIAKPDTGMHAVTALAIDPSDPATLYAVAVEAAPDETTTAAVAAVDLAGRTWRWQRGDGCGPGVPVALALADGIVVCAARGDGATVRATSRDGAARWDHARDHVDRVQAAGDTVIVHDAARLIVLDAATGRRRGEVASEDGAPVRAAVVAVGDATWLVTFERGRLVARLPAAGMLAAWSYRVHGVVRALAPSQDGVLVELEDGDAYRVTLPAGEATSIPGLDLAWRAVGELVTGATAGGPIPGDPATVVRPPAPRVRVPARPRRRAVEVDERNPLPPELWTPIPAPPPLGDSWQLSLYELTGGLRARNDYALTPPVAPAPARGPRGSPLVVAYGPGLREVLVLDPRTGDPVRRVRLPDAAVPGLVFGTVVDGTPVAGAVLAAPLRAVVF